MELRWRIESEKRWVNWYDKDLKEDDGGYEYLDVGGRILEFKTENGWQEVLDENGQECCIKLSK